MTKLFSIISIMSFLMCHNSVIKTVGPKINYSKDKLIAKFKVGDSSISMKFSFIDGNINGKIIPYPIKISISNNSQITAHIDFAIRTYEKKKLSEIEDICLTGIVQIIEHESFIRDSISENQTSDLKHGYSGPSSFYYRSNGRYSGRKIVTTYSVDISGFGLSSKNFNFRKL